MQIEHILNEKAVEFRHRYFATFYEEVINRGMTFPVFIQRESVYPLFVATLVKEYGAVFVSDAHVTNEEHPLTKKVYKELLPHIKLEFLKSLKQHHLEMTGIVEDAKKHTKRKLSLSFFQHSINEKDEWERRKDEAVSKQIRIHLAIQSLFGY